MNFSQKNFLIRENLPDLRKFHFYPFFKNISGRAIPVTVAKQIQ